MNPKYKKFMELLSALKGSNISRDTMRSIKKDFAKNYIETLLEPPARTISSIEKSAIILLDQKHYSSEAVDSAVSKLGDITEKKIMRIARKYSLSKQDMAVLRLAFLDPEDLICIPSYIKYDVPPTKSRFPIIKYYGKSLTKDIIKDMDKEDARTILRIIRKSLIPFPNHGKYGTFCALSKLISHSFLEFHMDVVIDVFKPSLKEDVKPSFNKPSLSEGAVELKESASKPSLSEGTVKLKDDARSLEAKQSEEEKKAYDAIAEVNNFFSDPKEREDFLAFVKQNKLALENHEQLCDVIYKFASSLPSEKTSHVPVSVPNIQENVSTTAAKEKSFVVEKYNFKIPDKYLTAVEKEHSLDREFVEDMIIFLVDGLRLFSRKQAVGNKYFPLSAAEKNFKRNPQSSKSPSKIKNQLKKMNVILIITHKKGDNVVSVNPHTTEYKSKSMEKLVGYILSASKKFMEKN